MTVKYFGKIAETIGKNTEVWETNNLTIESFKELLLLKYPDLQGQTFKIAVNLKLEAEQETLQQTDELAILPPFSGG